jgi:hypothetical protein
MILPAIKMPDYFTLLLRVNMQSSGQYFTGLQQYILNNSSFLGLAEIGLKDIDKDLHIEKIIKVLGWHGLRDRIATMIIYKKINGEFPDHIPHNNVYGLLDFEDKVKQNTVAGYSRAFLLGLYQKLMLHHIQEVDPNLKVNNMLVDDSTIALLRFAKSRTIKVDWLLILLKHFSFYLGYEELEKLLKSNTSYEEIFSCLELEQQEILMGNLLSYGSSINDSEIFYSKTI